MAWQFGGHAPVYLQIADRLRIEILNGEYSPGEQIPPVRKLAVTAAVNPNTVQRALCELENEGIICSMGTQGRFVTEDQAAISAARNRAARSLVREFLTQAEGLSIKREEIIGLIEEESNK